MNITNNKTSNIKNEYAVEMLNITKTFLNGKVVANDNVNLLVKRNEVHAIVGENGAGKSTLMSILFGLYNQDFGIVKVNGNEINFKSAKDANLAGLGMVHQHFKLVDEFPLWQNIILGSEQTNLLNFINKKKIFKKLDMLNKKYNFNLNLNMKAGKATVGQQQKTEILKLLYRDVDILIFDEPTAVLSDIEIKSFLNMIKDFKKENKTIIIITHKFNEIKEVADHVTVIRHGKYIDDFPIHKKTVEEMAELMVGKKIVEIKNTIVENFDDKNVVLEINDLDLKSVWKPSLHKINPTKKIIFNSNKSTEQRQLMNDNNDNAKNDDSNKINLKIHSGEILAIAGVEGNGQSELAQLVAGLLKNKTGDIVLNNKSISGLNIKERNKLGLSFVPEDRHKHGLILDFSIADNTVLNQIDNKPFSNHGIIDQQNIYDYAKKIIANFDVRGTTRGTSIVRGLSGGNQQKLIIGREMTKEHNLLVLVQPTRGLDLGAINFIHNEILKEKQKGNAILLISYELDEILALADTIGVMQNGVLVGYDSATKMTREKIGNFMVGKV